MGGSIFWTPGNGAKPWWVPPPIKMDFSPPMQVDFDNIKIDPNEQQYSQMTMDDVNAMYERQKLDHLIRCWNADFIRDLPEEQQWAFVNTMGALQSSVLSLSNGMWQEDNSICGALYGQNQAKIQMTSNLLGGKYADKMQTALDWFFDHTVGQQPRVTISKDNENFIKFDELFKKLGRSTNAGEFKQQMKNALNDLTDSVGNKYRNLPSNRPRINWANFVGFLVNDFDSYFSMLTIHGYKSAKNYLHKIDLIA